MTQRVNSAFGTFEPGHIIDMEDVAVAKAWVEAGIAEVPVVASARGPQVIEETPEKQALDQEVYEDDPPATPVKAEPDAARSSRRRQPTSHPSAQAGPTWGDKG